MILLYFSADNASMIMTGRRFVVIVFVPLLLFPTGCDEGLVPPTVATVPSFGAFQGIVTFKNWQAADSLFDLRLVAFQTFPPGDIINDVLLGKAVVYPSLEAGEILAPRGTDSLNYLIAVPALTYPYVVVAQQFGPDVFNDWKPVGQYDLDSVLTDPTPVVVVEGDTTSNVDICVDFANPPPVP